MSYYSTNDEGGFLNKIRLDSIASGRNVFGSIKLSSTSQMAVGELVQFIYKAKESGFPKKGLNPPNTNIYDSAPLVFITDFKRSKDNHLIMTGANIHYIPKKVDRGKVILSLNALNRIPTSLYKMTVHAYRLDRFLSAPYRSLDVTVDKDLLLSVPVWRPV